VLTLLQKERQNHFNANKGKEINRSYPGEENNRRTYSGTTSGGGLIPPKETERIENFFLKHPPIQKSAETGTRRQRTIKKKNKGGRPCQYKRGQSRTSKSG